ncbi:unnamed protein product [Phytophthora fragariaefolia]|uniref:Unnamed protein product n=1 Tax=Phytophthora fragariaefolia TaxID=1490495 RepID=A0A9W6Y6R5_9STRA|nr:unnamed protein product [Phytophthora fragariaefolia]
MSLSLLTLCGNTRPTAWSSFKRLVRSSFPYFVAAVGVTLPFSCLIAHLTSTTAPNVFKYKPDCFMNTLAGAGYFAGISKVVSQIYHEETDQGRDRLRSRKQKCQKSTSLRDPTATTRRRKSEVSRRFHTPSFWKKYVKVIPVALPSFLTCTIVQVLSQLHLVDRNPIVLTSFAIAIVIVKLLVQELVEHYLFQRRVRSIRAMCLVVGIPTVLIDTQTRIILLGTNSREGAIMGTIVMALLEITLRSVKAALVLWAIHRRRPVRRTDFASRLDAIVSMFRRPVAPLPCNSADSPISMDDKTFVEWRCLMQRFYIAELNADMYAEYVSIGCSSSVFFFYGHHARYPLLRRSDSSVTTALDLKTWRAEQLSILALQIGVEVLVDFVSIAFEMAVGIDFDQIKHSLSVEELQLPVETGTVLQTRITVQAWEETTDSRLPGAKWWHQVAVQLCSRSTWTTALKMHALVVRNAAESIACAWVPNAFYALGNIFSGKWYTDQSRNELLVSNSVYAGIGFCIVVFTSFLPFLMSLKTVKVLIGRQKIILKNAIIRSILFDSLKNG